MLKKLFLILLIAAPVSSFAQDKFAYLNWQEVFYKMPEMKDVEAKLATKQETIKKNVAAIESEYNTLLEKFKSDTTSVTESIYADREKQLQQLQERYQNFVQTSQTEYQKEQETLLAPLHQKMTKAVKEVGDENHYVFIVDSSALLYTGSAAVDAAPKVKTKLNITE